MASGPVPVSKLEGLERRLDHVISGERDEGDRFQTAVGADV